MLGAAAGIGQCLQVQLGFAIWLQIQLQKDAKRRNKVLFDKFGLYKH